jgi:hypothetical protein
MKMTDYYTTDPTDPYAPVKLEEYRGIRVGDSVVYWNPPPKGPLTVSAFYTFYGGALGDYTVVILNDGLYECSADNVRKEE